MSAVPTLEGVALDCPDPVALAEFYGELLGWGPVDVSDGGRWVNLPNPSGGVFLAFQRADDYRPPAWPSPDSPQHLHLDFTVDDMAAAQERALGIGAKLLDDSSDGFHVFADPVGHPFCLCVSG